MTKILITGGAGFIGSHTCLALMEKGYEVIVIDSFINSKPRSLEMVKKIYTKNSGGKQKAKIKICKGDLRNKEDLRKIFFEEIDQGVPISGVIHFAGLKAVNESIRNPLMYWENNLVSSINLLKVMKENECKHIVFSSSATVYGLSNKSNIKENSPLKPINPYGNNKETIEKILNDLFKSSSKDWCIANLRYFNPIGAHQSGLIGENPLGVPNNIFPIILKVASGNLSNLEIFGNDWPTSDGTCIRDYIHVMDLAEGHLKTLEFLFKNNSQILNLNLGTGRGISVLELVNTFERINNVNIPFKFVERRLGDACRVVADNTLAKTVLNWSPSKTIEQMCKDGWQWKVLNPNGY